MSVVNTCLDSGYTLHHRPRNTGRRGGGVIINNQIKVKSRMVCVNPEITSFESMELVITISSITIRLCYLLYAACELKEWFKTGTQLMNLITDLDKLSCMNGNIVITCDFNIDLLINGSERK